MEAILHSVAVLVALLSGVLVWIALAFASLPGSSISFAWYARAIRGLFYSQPMVIAATLFLLDERGWGLFWCFLPVVPAFLVFLIFKFVGRK